MSVSGADKSGRRRIYCTTHRESSSCPDPKTFYLVLVEETVISALRRELTHPAVFAEYAKTYAEERSRLARAKSAGGSISPSNSPLPRASRVPCRWPAARCRRAPK